jgi:Actinobacteria/chloroflexi VLRF1 release factor
VKNVAGSGVKWLDVSAERFPGWMISFGRRHAVAGPGEWPAAGEVASGSAAAPDGAAALGTLTAVPGAGSVTFTAPDGAQAECHPPFAESFSLPGEPGEPGDVAALVAAVATHAATPRTVGVLLVRLGGYAAGVFAGYPPALADAKVGSRLVHGRSAAGGWSQHRFARRREKQASEALDAAAGAVLLVFGRHAQAATAAGRAARLDAVVLGGDKRAAAELRDDPRLAPYLALATERFITVPDPKRAVLAGSPALFASVRIRLTSPPRADPPRTEP